MIKDFLFDSEDEETADKCHRFSKLKSELDQEEMKIYEVLPKSSEALNIGREQIIVSASHSTSFGN